MLGLQAVQKRNVVCVHTDEAPKVTAKSQNLVTFSTELRSGVVSECDG